MRAIECESFEHLLFLYYLWCEPHCDVLQCALHTSSLVETVASASPSARSVMVATTVSMAATKKTAVRHIYCNGSQELNVGYLSVVTGLTFFKHYMVMADHHRALSTFTGVGDLSH